MVANAAILFAIVAAPLDQPVTSIATVPECVTPAPRAVIISASLPVILVTPLALTLTEVTPLIVFKSAAAVPGTVSSVTVTV